MSKVACCRSECDVNRAEMDIKSRDVLRPRLVVKEETGGEKENINKIIDSMGGFDTHKFKWRD